MDKLKELLQDCQAIMEMISESGLGGTDAADVANGALHDHMRRLIKAASDLGIGDVSEEYPWLYEDES